MRSAVLRYCGIAVFAGSLLAQNQRTTGTIMVWAAPSGVCLANSPIEYYSSGNQYWGCVLPTITSLTGTWTQITGGGGGGATIPATMNIIKGDGAGNGADSGYVAQNATTSLTGFLTFTDWNTFNNKQAALGFTAVPNTRNINTISPLTGGGNLSGDLTLACPTCGTTSGTVTHTGALSADEPVFGNGTDDIKVGTKSGTTNEIASASGSFADGNCPTFSSGNIIDSGIPCSGGGGGGGGGNIVTANWTTLGATSTRTDSSGSITIVTASSGTNKIDGVYHTVAAGDFTIYLAFMVALQSGSSGPPAVLAGFTDGTKTEGLGIDSPAGATVQRGLKDDAISGGTTAAANGIISGTCTCVPVVNPVYIKLTRIGTALSAWLSFNNGITYVQYFNDTAPYMTATAVAVYIQSRSSLDTNSFTLISSSLP